MPGCPGGIHTCARRSAPRPLPSRSSSGGRAGVAPLLDLQADQDPFRTESTRREIKDEFGDRVTVVVIQNASHALFPEHPQEVAAALAHWITRLPAP